MRRNRRRGRLRPPPPTPPGMVWETDGSKLVTAEEFAEFSRREMTAFDKLPAYSRQRYRESGEDILSQEPAWPAPSQSTSKLAPFWTFR